MTRLTVENVHKSYPAPSGQTPVLQGVSLSLEAGELLALLGRSGCGKSTLLRLIGAFETPDTGRILLDAVPVKHPTPRCFMVFQSFDQLFPWKRVEDNLVYALLCSKIEKTKAAARDRARFWLGEVGLEDSAQRWPHELSGGMKQRAALARAFSLEPELLLLDEPFSGLDSLLRESMQGLLLRLCRRYQTSALFVTHDIGEARRLCDSPAVMRPDGSEILRIGADDTADEQIRRLLAPPDMV